MTDAIRSPLTQYEKQSLDDLLPKSAYDYDPERLRFELEQMLEVLIAKRELRAAAVKVAR